MIFDDEKFEETSAELENLKTLMEENKETINGIINGISTDWESEASQELCKNMQESLKIFQSYIGQLQKIIAYINQSCEEITKAETINNDMAAMQSALNGN